MAACRIRGIVVLAIGLEALICGCGERGARELVVVSYGGSFQEAQRKAFFEPFSRETGIKIVEAQWSGEYAKLKAMVVSKHVTWDLVTAAESSIIARGAGDSILARIDFTNIDRSRFYGKAITPFSVGFDYFATVLAFNELDYPIGADRPSSWTDFWDVSRFPGSRCLRKDPRTTLEFALLADGVPATDLYPLDIDRAFRSLDRIRPHVSVWWSSGHQPAQLLADREVRMASAFNGRIWAAARGDSVPLRVEWNMGALDVDAWIIPRGAPHYKEAMKLVEYTCRPDVQLALTKYIAYSPTMPEAYEHLAVEQRRDLPTAPENYPRQFTFDGEWWAANEAAVLERWNTWITQ